MKNFFLTLTTLIKCRFPVVLLICTLGIIGCATQLAKFVQPSRIFYGNCSWFLYTV